MKLGIIQVQVQLGAVSHDVSSMTCMENKTEGFREIISRIDDSRDVEQFNISPCFPILNSKESNINVS